MRRLRLAVVGAGHMGSLHVRKIAALRAAGAAVELAGVADIVTARARAAASAHGARAVGDGRELIGDCDAAVIAVPTHAHHAVALPWLDAARDVLIEKPIAATLEQGEQLLALARRGGRVLQVGHLEWFNGGMQSIGRWLSRPRFAEVHRLGPFPGRGTDVDVVRDLMIHDIEILQRLLGEEPERLDAVGVPVLSDEVDVASARLHFPGGCVANLTASRVAASPMRRLRLFERDGYVSIDFLAQSATSFRRGSSGPQGAPLLRVEQLQTGAGDALLRQLHSFVDAVRTRRAPAVDAACGLAALRTALRVRAAIAAAQQAPDASVARSAAVALPVGWGR